MYWKKLTSTGAKPLARSSHTLTVIKNKAYVFGGENLPRTPVGNELFSFDSDTHVWEQVQVHGDPPTARLGHGAAAVGDTLYIFGGRSGTEFETAHNDLYAFDTRTNTWESVTAKGSLPPKRSYLTMAADSQRLYVFGGCGEAGRLNDLYAFDPSTTSWEQLPSSDAIKGRGGPGFVVDGTGHALVVIAGFCGEEMDDVHSFDLESKTWKEHAELSGLPKRSVFGFATHGTCASCAHGNHIVVIGGEEEASAAGHAGAGRFSNDAYCLDVTDPTHGWHKLNVTGDTPAPRGWFAAAPIEQGILVFGGNSNNNDRLDDLYVLQLH